MKPVSPIIDDDIEEGYLLFEVCPEFTICLISHKDLYLLIVVAFTSLFDIYAIDSALRPEILFPHLKAPSTVYSNFQDMYFLSNELGKMAVIYLEIVLPFPNASSLCV